MTHSRERKTPDNAWNQALAFLASLTIGLAGGLGLLFGGWLLMNSAAGNTIGDALAITSQTPWYFSRSAGITAYALLAGSTIWGLLLSTKVFKESVPAALALALHNILSWLAVLLTGMHALALLWDSYYSYTLADIAIPFAGPYRAGWVGLGIIGFYLMFITSISFNFRKQIGQKNWKRLHYTTFALFLMATMHGIAAGTDSGTTAIQALYWGSGMIVLLLTLLRLRKDEPTGSRQSG